MYCVYKYVYQNEIIYIGKTDTSLEARIYGHSKENKFKPYLADCEIYYALLKNATETDVYEKILINEHRPKLNVADKQAYKIRGISFNEPKWVKYVFADGNIDISDTTNNILELERDKKRLKVREYLRRKAILDCISQYKNNLRSLKIIDYLEDYMQSYTDDEIPDDLLIPDCFLYKDDYNYNIVMYSGSGGTNLGGYLCYYKSTNGYSWNFTGTVKQIRTTIEQMIIYHQSFIEDMNKIVLKNG